MGQQTINIGTVANDGTGDPIRDAMDKINNNFDEMYSSFIMSGAVTVGNSTVNSVVSNTGGLVTGNTTANAIANSTILKIANSSANVTLTPSSFSISDLATVNTTAVFIGNSTVNTSHSVSSLQLANSTTNTTITPSTIFVGNSTVNTSANSSYLKTDSIEVTSANITSNNLSLGTFNDGANGYTYLPNGLKMNWGSVSSNSSSGYIIFASAFTNSVFSVVATSNATGTYAAAVITQNTTSAEIRTANTTSTTVYYTAIGK